MGEWTSLQTTTYVGNMVSMWWDTDSINLSTWDTMVILF